MSSGLFCDPELEVFLEWYTLFAQKNTHTFSILVQASSFLYHCRMPGGIISQLMFRFLGLIHKIANINLNSEIH